MKNYKNTIKLVVLLLAIFAYNSVLMAQLDEHRTLDTKIADLLARFPANNEEALDKNMTELADLGEEGIIKMINMLVPSGQGNNTKIEYAIGGFSRYVTDSDNSELRNMMSNAYCETLGQLSDPDHKAFIIRQLQIAGTNSSISCLQTFLEDERLCGDAARAISSISTEDAGTALTKALDNASGFCKNSIIEAIGDIQYDEAVEKIIPLAKASDPQLQKVSLYALAQMGHPDAQSVMTEVLEEKGYKHDLTNAFSSYELYLRHLAENGDRKNAQKAASKLFKTLDETQTPNLKAVALKLVIDLDGKGRLKQLTKAANSENEAYRAAALQYAIEMFSPNDTETWVKEMNKADNSAKAEIMSMLAEVDAHAALPAILEILKDSDGKVRLSAIEAAGHFGGEQVLSQLLEVMKTGTPEEIMAVKDALLVLDGDVVNKTAEAFSEMSNTGKVAAIELFAARGANSEIDLIYAALESGDEALNQAGYNALQHVTTVNNLSKLFNILNTVDDSSEELENVQNAIITAIQHSDNPIQHTSAVLTEMEKSPSNKKSGYLGILANLGSDEALKAVTKAYDEGDEQLQQSALDALASWTDAAALDKLFNICEQTDNEKYFDQAFRGYVQLINDSDHTDAQKVLLLRKGMSIAKTDDQKGMILGSLSNYKTFQALIFAGEFMDHEALAHTASWAVSSIALEKPEYYGETVRKLLKKAIEKLQGNDSEYQKAAIRKHLDEMPEAKGFVPLFNGKDLNGWKGLVENPIVRAKMSEAKLAKAQQKANKIMEEGWKAEDGVLIFTGEGENICTEKEYGDFEMYVDWKIEEEGDAGIYLRGSPQVQIWDPARVDAGAQVGSGGLYNNQNHESDPLVKADNPVGEWNTFHIKMIGDKVTVHLNGKLVVDNVVMENYWDRDQPIFSKGQIELQAHGTKVFYRDIYIREVSKSVTFSLSDEEKAEGYQILFDGTNLDQWTGNKTDYAIEDGAIVVNPDQGGNGNLYTKNNYGDFNFRFEFQLTEGANNGLGIRTPMEGDAAYEGMELQILDNTADIYKDLKPYQFHGSVYGVIPAKRGFLKPTGKWNFQEVIVKGNNVKVILNGEVILDGNIEEASKNGTLDGRDHPGLKRNSGHIAFLGHGSVVKFRNIRIKELD